MEYLNGGIKLLLEHMHDKGTYNLPLKNQAYILYNMSAQNIYDPSVYQ